MEAKELRIGNWVSRLGYYKQIKSIEKGCGKIDYVSVGEVFTSNQIDPIPLTEEWLKKFGFVKVANHYEKNCFNIYKYKDEIEIEFRNDEDDESFVIGMRYNYVHQLQNLYFAVTGEELIIKNELL